MVVLWRTPGYADYHWLARPDLDDDVRRRNARRRSPTCCSAFDAAKPEDAEILELFGAESFIATKDSNYDVIEKVARDQGLLT